MSEPFLGEIKLISFNFAPKGWALCDGQLMPINQNQALFSILGTTYGGDGRLNFGLPDLRGRVPVSAGNGIVLGEKQGEEAHTLNISELPAHTHKISGSKAQAVSRTVSGQVWGLTAASSYNTLSALPAGDGVLSPAAVSNAGGSQPHINMQPYLTINFCIALQGIFPSPN
ncbi:tail fiber protein [Paenibacillus filicis]|uniref:Tail fiber protein n=1 Tax=Paenibacillus gyeongsangnamensis TaxID=3388067 RepID=A0ABT4Q8U4_9BACL|nr:tail fiber protein [Paenibacillus filicis]MCZ8513241.1 tail fiber protein [Paenibacillus filicis]